MTNKRIISQAWLIAGAVILLVAIDQALKLYIRTHFMLGEAHEILPFFQLCFVENNGMAFGIQWLPKWCLTAFRIVMVGVLGWYINLLLKRQARASYLTMITLITAGALGNIIDCVFYGKLFGYETWFYGKVVDMLYFPLIHNAAGETLFFRPVFNLADSYITIAVFAIILFFRKDLNDSLETDKSNTETKKAAE
ncbi:MAG: signal peptidase II [Paludibacteraceae bacterium]|nr:signal peptidase II [Paludibacteraceae bacterium]